MQVATDQELPNTLHYITVFTEFYYDSSRCVYYIKIQYVPSNAAL